MKSQFSIQYPRSLAVQVLVRVLSEYRPLDEVLASAADQLPPDGLPWLQEICSGTLRWKGRLDWILDSLSVKKKPSGWLRKILLLAAYQLVVQDRVPAAMVVSETVSAVKANEGEAPARFANACLRKVAEHAVGWRNWEFPQATVEEQAAWASLPGWLWVKLVKQQGLPWARAYALASLERPTLWISRKDLNHKEAEGHYLPGPVAGAWQAVAGGLVTERAGFQEGQWIVQDISSQVLISEVVARIQKENPERNSFSALDLCASPGGKSVGLAWRGYQVEATDYNEGRIHLLEKTISRTAPSVQILRWKDLGTSGQKDLVWVDAPCSGTGILRRHPDVRWMRQEKELPGLIKTQRELLSQAWERVPSGGFLAYSVCSVLKEEGSDAIRAAGLESAQVAHWFLAPQTDPFGDGFWASLLKKQF